MSFILGVQVSHGKRNPSHNILPRPTQVFGLERPGKYLKLYHLGNEQALVLDPNVFVEKAFRGGICLQDEAIKIVGWRTAFRVLVPLDRTVRPK